MIGARSQNVTYLLERWRAGDREAFERVSRCVEPDLRQIACGLCAHERSNHTLQPTALINEAFLRILKQRQRLQFDRRSHFFSFATAVMRRVLVDHARKHRAAKRGGGVAVLAWDEETAPAVPPPSLEVLALEGALRRLEECSPRQARVVELRYFAGLTVPQTARALAVSPATIKIDWAMARAFLFRELMHERVPDERA